MTEYDPDEISEETTADRDLSEKSQAGSRDIKLTPYMSPLGAWALSVGSAIGWGSFVFTGNSYLLKAGPAGSVIGMFIGAVIMLIIGRNYHYLMNRYPDAGGVYAYVTEIFGHDRAFLAAWFLFLTYIAVFWANATSLPLFARYFFGDLFRFGPHYTIAEYEVYLGEALLSITAIVLMSILCMYARKLTQGIVIILAVVFTAGLTICVAVALLKRDPAVYSMNPVFLPDSSIASQIVSIACMAPWAYVGFENISHSAEEFSFSHKKSFKIISWSVIVTTLLYMFIVILSVTAYPEGFNSWQEYIAGRESITGLDALPTFYAGGRYMGVAGKAILSAVLFGLIFSSLIGMIMALSRLLYAMAKDHIIPVKFAKLSKRGIPYRTVLIITAISVFIPFAGRTAIGWIVDVTTIGTILVFCFVSAAVYKMGRVENVRCERCMGLAGIIVMVLLAVLIQVPSFTADSSMAKESYFLFTIWGVLGFIFFRGVINKDSDRRFGNSVIVWIGMLALILFTALTWMGESTREAADDAIMDVRDFYTGEADISVYQMSETEFVDSKIETMNKVAMKNSIVVLGMFALSCLMILSNYRTMRRREKENEEKLGEARNKIYQDQLTGVKSMHAYAEKEASMNMRIKDNLVEEYSVVVCDVNGLKQINDTLGHKAGDEYIRTASMMICKQFKHSPVYRIGGDEFVVILEGDDYANRQHLMNELNETVEYNNDVGGVVIAAGMSDFIQDGDVSLYQVFERADSLMYTRKRELKGEK
ncbi:MAG: amino acid permease [Lachnospiraceae bacterium]|nr:amino acid permease [Lachnospiraceae bacterium]